VEDIPGFPGPTRPLPLNEGFRGRGSKVSMTSGVMLRSGSGSVHSSESRGEVRDDERLTVPSRSGPLRYNEDGRLISGETQGAIPKPRRSFASRIFGSRASSQIQYLPNPAPSGRSGALSQNNIKVSDLLGVRPEFHTGRTHLCHKWCHQVLVL
jgi:hypothetical protein